MFAIKFSLFISLLDFFVNTNPNMVIFNFVDSSWSLLSKNTSFPNFSLQFIVLFDQISIHIKNTLIIRVFDPYSTLY